MHDTVKGLEFEEMRTRNTERERERETGLYLGIGLMINQMLEAFIGGNSVVGGIRSCRDPQR